MKRPGNRDIVAAFFANLQGTAEEQARGFQVILENYLAPDFIYWVSGMGNIQDALLGKTESPLGRFGQELIGRFEMRVHATTVEGDRVAVEAESFARLQGNITYNNWYHFLIELRGGKIIKIREYCDTFHRVLTVPHLSPPYTRADYEFAQR